MIFFSEHRAARGPRRPPGYPKPVLRLLSWYDHLSDRQRIQYAVASMLFLLACGGYLLGLGSTMLLQRVEAQDALAAVDEAPTPRWPDARQRLRLFPACK